MMNHYDKDMARWASVGWEPKPPNHHLVQGDPDRVPWLTAIQRTHGDAAMELRHRGSDLQARVGDLRPHGMSAPKKNRCVWGRPDGQWMSMD